MKNSRLLLTVFNFIIHQVRKLFTKCALELFCVPRSRISGFPRGRLEQLENALKHSDYERLIFTERASQDGSKDPSSISRWWDGRNSIGDGDTMALYHMIQEFTKKYDPDARYYVFLIISTCLYNIYLYSYMYSWIAWKDLGLVVLFFLSNLQGSCFGTQVGLWSWFFRATLHVKPKA